MLLDYNPSSKLFFVKVPRGDLERELIQSHGLNLSLPASTNTEACLFTAEPMAAVTWFEQGTDRAKAQLQGIYDAIQASWKSDGQGHYRMPADKELWGFQKATLEYMLGRDHTLVGHEPGLGKTCIAIVYANEIQARRVLVVCPAAIRLQWQKKNL